MCNGDCNQGRQCDCTGEEGDPGRGMVIGLGISVALWALIVLVVSLALSS